MQNTSCTINKYNVDITINSQAKIAYFIPFAPLMILSESCFDSDNPRMMFDVSAWASSIAR